MSLFEPNIERLMAQFRHKKLDRVPHFEEIIGGKLIKKILKRDVPGCTRDISPKDYVELAQRIGMDAIVFYPNQNFGGELYEEAGDSFEQKNFYVTGVIQDWKDLEMIKPVDTREMLERQDNFRAAIGNSAVGLCVWVVAGFTRACLNMGYQNFMLKVSDDYRFIRRLMEIQMGNTMREVEEVCSKDISFIVLGDDLADSNGFMVSPGLLEELYFPAIRKIIGHIKQKGYPVMFHCCGNLKKVLPYLLEAGVDAVHPVQSNCNDIYQMKKDYAQEICLVGNIGITDPLTNGTVVEVVADVKSHIDRLANPPGYVLCSDHSIADCIPVENFLAMVETCHSYGRYKKSSPT